METQANQHPKGLTILSLVCGAERFSYYGTRAILILFLVSAFFSRSFSSELYGSFTGLVYLMPLLGGYIADRYWGNRRSVLVGGLLMALGHFSLFFSAATVKQSIFFEGGPIDASINNTIPEILLIAGLFFLVMGNGFFKAPLSSMVGQLYPEQDSRLDAAYSIFYSFINAGAFFSPLFCGLFEGDWSDPTRFRWAFLIAGCVMLLSVTLFLWKQSQLLGPDGQPIGQSPNREVQTVTEMEEKTTQGYGIGRILLCTMVAVAMLALFGLSAKSITDGINAVVYTASLVIPLAIILDKNLTYRERIRIIVVYIIVAFSVAFWSVYEQAGCSLTLLVKDNVDCGIGGWQVPASWFQSVNPIIVVLFAPAMAWMWRLMGKNEPTSIMKQAIGLILLSLGYAVIFFGVRDISDTIKISMLWVIAMYFFHSIGELWLSPVGMSLVQKLSPARLGSLMMGLWLCSSATSNIFAGQLSSLYPEAGQPAHQLLGFTISSMSDFFLIMVIIPGLAGILLACLTPVLNRMAETDH